jgi:carboxypeptidase family protein
MRAAIVLGTVVVFAACGGDSSGPATGNVSGLIKDTANVPLEQVQIEIRNSGTVTIVRSVASSAAGMFNAVGLAAGAYDVFVQTPTAMTGNSLPVTVTGGATATANFTFGYVTVSFATHIGPLLNASCGSGGCHGGASPQHGMFLVTDSAYKYTVNVASAEVPTMDRIEPGNTSQSYLIHKLENTQGTVGGSGVRMPQGAAALNVQTIRMIRRWVTAGALNN